MLKNKKLPLRVAHTHTHRDLSVLNTVCYSLLIYIQFLTNVVNSNNKKVSGLKLCNCFTKNAHVRNRLLGKSCVQQTISQQQQRRSFSFRYTIDRLFRYHSNVIQTSGLISLNVLINNTSLSIYQHKALSLSLSHTHTKNKIITTN